MKKIPTLFVRDEATNRRYVKAELTPGCEWVLAGHGWATRKYDGTCCLVRDGVLYKRREVKGGTLPEGFEYVDHDDVTGKTVGWVAVGDGPEDKWHREAFGLTPDASDGTYELIGPKVQGNPEGEAVHVLIPHATADRLALRVPADVPGAFAALRDALTSEHFTYEGVVWHGPGGLMAKLKRKDFHR